jgi:hypothetical protein
MAEVNAAQRLVGAWSLVSWRIFGADDALLSEPFGPHPRGLLQYTADHWMSAAIGFADRPLLPAGTSPRRMPPEILAEAWRNYFHYAGRWRIVDDSVIHSVELSLNPNMVGTEQVRHMQFDGSTLTLTGTENVGEHPRRHLLLWQKARSPAEN